MSAQTCPVCLSSSYEAGNCKKCGFKKAEYKSTPTALPMDTVVDEYRIGVLKASSRQSQIYTGIHGRTSVPVIIEEFFPQKMAGRIPGNIQVLIPEQDQAKERRFQQACIQIEASAQQRPLKRIGSFRANNTIYSVFEIKTNVPLAVQCESLADYPYCFRDANGAPMMTINALEIPPMPAERPFNPSQIDQKTPQTEQSDITKEQFYRNTMESHDKRFQPKGKTKLWIALAGVMVGLIIGVVGFKLLMDHNETVGNNTEGNAAATVNSTEGVEPAEERSPNEEETSTTEPSDNNGNNIGPEESPAAETEQGSEKTDENTQQGNEDSTTGSPSPSSDMGNGLSVGGINATPTPSETESPTPDNSDKSGDTPEMGNSENTPKPDKSAEAEDPTGTGTVETDQKTESEELPETSIPEKKETVTTETGDPEEPEATTEEPSKPEENDSPEDEASEEKNGEETPSNSAEASSKPTLVVLVTTQPTISPEPTPLVMEEYVICSGAYGYIDFRTKSNTGLYVIIKGEFKDNLYAAIVNVDDTTKKDLDLIQCKADDINKTFYKNVKNYIENEDEYFYYYYKINLGQEKLSDGRYELRIGVDNDEDETWIEELFRVKNKKIKKGWGEET